MMEPKSRKSRIPEEERELPPEALAEGEKIVRQYSAVLKALAKH